MNRNIFPGALCVLLLVVSFSAQAQQSKRIPRIGFIASGTPSTSAPCRDAFQQGLRGLGYIEGKNILVEYRFAEGKLDRIPDLATELVGLKLM